MGRDQDIGESSMVRDEPDDNQIVLIPEHLQHTDDSDEFQPTPNGTPYWVPDVPEDEKPKKGPTRAHRLKAALVGWYDKVRGTSTDYCNFRAMVVTSIIEIRDAQELVEIKCGQQKLQDPEFCFEYTTLPSKICQLFWADVTMKCNYVAFGDVVSFDATFHTNKYGYKFVPFTGIDHNQRCVTFSVALISDETTESFSWMLEAFLKTYKKHPPFVVTDQDGALRNVVLKVFPDSHHRLCIWHITEKLPSKVI
ncbi:FAR1-related sequence 5-like protein [Tanacetum coccineum]|uniref:FAR1-related sequence 5-like protein n=1 Tax=Tanacetum coccineum TaxID=301880 RepID=A0ABQ5BI27_9ASTR